MNRRRIRFIQAAFFAVLILPVARAARNRFAGGSATFPAWSFEAPDAAAAMRSISGVTGPPKPWATDLTSFAAEHPGQWIVGRCAGPCLSQAEALQSARSDASRAVFGIALNRLGPAHGDQHWLAQRVQSDVQAGKLLSDDLLEHFDRPYGTIWTDSVLLNASPEQMDGLLTEYKSALQVRSDRTKGIEFAAGAVTIGAWLAYLLCNAITRGYFSLRLQLIAGTITAMALLVLLGGP